MDIQIIFNTIADMFMIAFPFSLVLTLVAKVTNVFLSFVFGEKEVSL